MKWLETKMLYIKNLLCVWSW